MAVVAVTADDLPPGWVGLGLAYRFSPALCELAACNTTAAQFRDDDLPQTLRADDRRDGDAHELSGAV